MPGCLWLSQHDKGVPSHVNSVCGRLFLLRSMTSISLNRRVWLPVMVCTGGFHPNATGASAESRLDRKHANLTCGYIDSIYRDESIASYKKAFIYLNIIVFYVYN